jgi:hypothetical protein
MRIIVKIISIFLLILFIQFIFADEHNNGPRRYRYYNSDGSLDWDTFYARWDEVPNSYYIYLKFIQYDHNNANPRLDKEVGSIMSSNEITFTYSAGRYKLLIKFSPLNYSNADVATLNYTRIGQKRNNYGEAIEQWNFMLNHME